MSLPEETSNNETTRTMKESCPDCGKGTALTCFYSWAHLYCQRDAPPPPCAAVIFDLLDNTEKDSSAVQELPDNIKQVHGSYFNLKKKGVPKRFIWHLLSADLAKSVEAIADLNEVYECPKKTCFLCYMKHKSECEVCKKPSNDQELFIYARMARLQS